MNKFYLPTASRDRNRRQDGVLVDDFDGHAACSGNGVRRQHLNSGRVGGNDARGVGSEGDGGVGDLGGADAAASDQQEHAWGDRPGREAGRVDDGDISRHRRRGRCASCRRSRGALHLRGGSGGRRQGANAIVLQIRNEHHPAPARCRSGRRIIGRKAHIPGEAELRGGGWPSVAREPGDS